jgi:hypothetical protein
MKQIILLLLIAGVLLSSCSAVKLFRRPDPCVKLQSEGYKKKKLKKQKTFYYKYSKPKYRYKYKR